MRIDVIVPVRDAAALLPGCLDAIRNQTLAPTRIHLSVAPSTDATGLVAAREAAVDPRIVVHANAAGDRGSGLNVVLDALDPSVEVVAMVDAQTTLAADYLERAAAVLEETGAAVVGGPMRPVGEGVVPQAIAAALCSRVGVGNPSFRFEGPPRDAESVYLGVYRRSAIDAVGRYNPRLLRTEDDDMNARIRAAGGRIRLDPAIRSSYRGRRTLAALFSQYRGYGRSKVALAAVRPDALRPRHLAPAGLVGALVIAGITTLGGWAPALPLLVGAYGGTLCLTGLVARLPIASRMVMPLALAAMHLGYGIGTWEGLARGEWRR